MSLCSSANRVDVLGCSGSMLIQAIRSHIYFSQLSAWLSRSKGSVPSQVMYRSVLNSDQSDKTTVSLYLTLPICMEKNIFYGGNWPFRWKFFGKKKQWNNFRGLMIMIRKCYHLLFTLFPCFFFDEIWSSGKWNWTEVLSTRMFWNSVKWCTLIMSHPYSLNICTVPVGGKCSLGFSHRWRVLIIRVSLWITTWSWQLTLSPLFVCFSVSTGSEKNFFGRRQLATEIFFQSPNGKMWLPKSV